MTDAAQGARSAPPDLWDPVVRISHWGLALVVLANAALTRGGGVWHIWLGWIGMALLILRLVWGLIGPAEARFVAFPPNPRAAIGHLRALGGGDVARYPSHNPAGAMMIYAFWAALAVVITTGLIMTGGATPMQAAADQAAVAAGDWAALIRDGGGAEEAGKGLKTVHEVAANLLLLMAGLHVAGVLVESRAMRRNLLAPMIAGRRGAARK